MEKIAEYKNAMLYRIVREDLPSNTYIISNPDSQKIHFDPTITDFELYKLSTKCNEAFLSLTKELGLFEGMSAKNITELILVSGGFYYHLNQAFYNVFGYSLPAGFLGVRRVIGDDPYAVISYDNFEAIPENNVTIIGDTIATGATLIDSIKYYLEKAPRVKKLLIFTIAGALPGAQRLAELEKEMSRKYGIELHVFFSDGIFGLDINQTDMKYFHKDSIIAPESQKAAEKDLGKFLGEKLCVIWDWGQRNKDPIGHLQEVVRVAGNLGEEGEGIVKRARAKLAQRERAL